MVGGANRGGDDAVSNALMSLLREGGQWDEVDDKRTGTGGTDGSSALNLNKKDADDEEFGMEPQRNSAVSLSINPHTTCERLRLLVVFVCPITYLILCSLTTLSRLLVCRRGEGTVIHS